MRYGLLLSHTKITAPLVVSHNVALLGVGIHCLKRASDCIVDRRISRTQERAKAQYN
jgi:hypothetical protein